MNRSVGFGLEKLGLICSRHPVTALIVIILISIASVFGLARLDFDSNLRNAFRSNNPEYRTFERTTKIFPASDQDVLILVTSPTLTGKKGIAVMRKLHLELQLADGVEHVISIFSLRRLGVGPGEGARLFPTPLPQGGALQKIIEQAATHPLNGGKLLSSDQRSALFVVRLDRAYPDIRNLQPVIKNLREISHDIGQKAGLKVALTGIPVIRIEITRAVIRDQIIFNGLGGLAGLLICFLVFRNWRLTLIALAPAGLAVLWSMGGMGLVGQKITYMTNVVPILVMVIAFCDSMHLTFGLRRRLQDGYSLQEALTAVIRDIGPACVLTSLTTAIALLSLTFADSAYVAEFGLASGLSMLAAYFAAISLVPVLAQFLLSKQLVAAQTTATAGTRQTSTGVTDGNPLLATLATAAAFVVRRQPHTVVIFGSIGLIAASVLFLIVQPHYQYGENLPNESFASRTLERINTEMGGATQIKILVEWPATADLKQVLDLVLKVDAAAKAHLQAISVWSMGSFSDYLNPDGEASPNQIRRRLEDMPEDASRRLFSPNTRSTVVLGFVEEGSSTSLNKRLNLLEQALEKIRRTQPGWNISATGFAVVSARLSVRTINELRLGLIGAILVITLLIAFAFRSWRVAILSLPTNLFPLALAGAYLFLTDSGLQFTTAIALTVGFGIAVDDTIHFLNTYRLTRITEDKPGAAVQEALRLIGPVLIATTAILIAGLGLVFFSNLPMVQLFGLLVILVLVIALLADMLYLPALITLLDRRRTKSGRDTR